MKEKFYSLDEILKRCADYNIIFGERSNGKSYSVLKYALEKYCKNGEQLGYIRRFDDDIKPKFANQVYKNLVVNGEINKLSKGKYNDITYISGAFYLQRVENGEVTERDENPCTYAFALNLEERYKSTSYPLITTILFDEFITRKYYLIDEFIYFTSILSTIIRLRDNVKIFMCGNTVNKFACPYFKEMGLKHLKEMKKGNIATVLKKGSEWSKVRSGNVTGYVKNQYLVFGDEIENFAKQNVKKVAKVQTETLRVRKKASTDSKIVTLVSEDDKLKVKKQTNDWAKVKVDGQTGYVSKDYAKVTYSFGKAKSMKQIQAEQEAKEAKKRAEEAARSKSENESVSTTSSGHTSDDGTTSGSTTGSTQTTKKASVSVSSSGSSATGSRIASYAQQFVGNPYRYGGNSLTNGIDCSGFTQQIMAKFGYSISRTSSSQSGDGRAVSTSNLRAGDLVFYGDGGSIDHVALYIGGGQVVHASNSAPYPRGGIKISNVNYRTPICARRIIG